MACVIELNPDDSSESDKIFDQIIETEKIAEILDQPDRCRSTKEQCIMLDTAMDCEEDIDDDRWNTLVVELNNIGPPKRSLEKWKRVWAVRKYNKKRQPHQDVETCSKSCSTVDDDRKGTTPDNSPETLYEQIMYGLQRVEAELHNVEMTLKTTNSILETKLETTNQLLDKLLGSSVTNL